MADNNILLHKQFIAIATKKIALEYVKCKRKVINTEELIQELSTVFRVTEGKIKEQLKKDGIMK